MIQHKNTTEYNWHKVLDMQKQNKDLLFEPYSIPSYISYISVQQEKTIHKINIFPLYKMLPGAFFL